ncbi:MAG: transposase [Bacteroidia bacterium]
MKNQDLFIENEFYHVYNRAVGIEKLFFSDENRRYFLLKLGEYLLPFSELHAYCLLDNHFHLLIRVNENVEDKKLTNAFRSWFISYTKALNKQKGRNGGLFTRPFKRKHINKESYYSAVIRYIHHNPRKHGIMYDFTNYQWSSYQAIISTKPTKLSRDFVLNWFENRDEFVKFHDIENEVERTFQLED